MEAFCPQNCLKSVLSCWALSPHWPVFLEVFKLCECRWQGNTPQGFSARAVLLEVSSQASDCLPVRPEESEFGGLWPQQVRILSLLCHRSSISSTKESCLPQKSRSICLLHQEHVEMERYFLRRLQLLVALYSASHRMDRKQLWANPQGSNSNSQSLNSYKTHILTPGLTKKASCQKR